MTSIETVIEQRRVVVCCGSGGVGKTTAAAAIALEGARRGRNACVVTIDPAKRLASALGLKALSDTPSEIERARWADDESAPGGHLSALMLDTKSTFDRLVTRHAASPDQAQGILDNRFYRNVSGALGGTQEYMAMEKLYELHDEGGFDLIVVDTPPTRHALEFLDAPRRLIKLLDNRIFRVLMVPTRASLKVAGFAVQAFLRTVSKVVGAAVIDDIVAFLRAFQGMEEGFRDRAAAVETLLRDPETAFVLVTSPRRDAKEEAVFFADRLAQRDQHAEALVVNRVHPTFGSESPEGLRRRAIDLRARPGADPNAADRLAILYDNLADFRTIAIQERDDLDGLREATGSASVVYVPYLAHDVYDFDALREVGAALTSSA